MYLIDDVLKYAISDTTFVYAATAFTDTLVDIPVCFCITEPKPSKPVPHQIDAEVHKYELRIRAQNIAAAFNLSAVVYAKFTTSNTADEFTGFIQISPELTGYVAETSFPVLVETDQQNRKTFMFTVLLITKRTI